MHRAGRPWFRLSTTGSAAALALGACGGDDDKSAADLTTSTSVEETTTTAPPETTITVAPIPEEEVLAAYAVHWKAVRDAFAPPVPDPELPALREHTTGEVLRYAIENAEKAVQDNEAYVVPDDDESNHRVEVLSIDGDTATVRDCTIDKTVVINTASGEVIDDAVSTRLYISMLVRENGAWKTSVLRREADWEGVAGCALENRSPSSPSSSPYGLRPSLRTLPGRAGALRNHHSPQRVQPTPASATALER